MGKLSFPKELVYFFLTSPERSLRDLASVGTKAINPLIKNESYIERIAQEAHSNPFDERMLTFDPNYRCHSSDTAARYMHIDLALTGNAAGIAMAHVGSWEHQTVGEGTMLLPKVDVDFVGRVTAPPGGEIQFDRILRDVVFELTERQFNIRLVTFDGFQSAHSIQILRSKGYTAARMSIDHTVVTIRVVRRRVKENGFVTRSTEGNTLICYYTLRDLIYSLRFTMAKHIYFLKELAWAERSLDGKGMDYPHFGSDDVLQAVCAAVTNTITNEDPRPYYSDTTDDERKDIVPESKQEVPWETDWEAHPITPESRESSLWGKNTNPWEAEL